jgi:lysophospholipase L1-like esterase
MASTSDPRRFRRGAANLLLAAAAIVVVFMAAETALRVGYHIENLGTVIRFDSRLGWSLIPGSSVHSVDDARGLDYTIRVNRWGLRERDFGWEKPDGVRRVVFMGDSFAFGVGVEQDRRLSDFVGRALDGGFEVINAAVCGWGTDQELIQYQRTVRRLEPDVVVLTVCVSNDVLNNMLDHLYLGSTPKPWFVLADSLELRNGNIPPPEIAGHHRLRNLLRRSHFLVFVKRRLDLLRDRPTGIAAADPVHPGYRVADRHSHSHWSVFERESDDEMEQAWDVTEAILEHFAGECRRDGVDLIVLAFPLELEVDDAWRSQMLERTGIDPDDLDIERPFARLESCCNRLGVPFLHPLESFRKASRHNRLYLERDVHPNARGHALAAAAVLSELRHRYGIDVHVAAQDRDMLGPLN